jgi:putative endonuclease
MDIKKAVGDAGETAVAEYIKNLGYIISKRNYRTKYGEIDIIAEDNDQILFVEIKTHSNNSFASPKEYVDKHKQRRILITAGIYLKYNGYGLEPRFDVAEVFVDNDGKMQINYIKNAFGADALENF